jgi:nitrogen fixation-related uncharacterized protein
MASAQENAMLAMLSDEIDHKLVEWMQEHKLPPLNLTAVILARLTWLAKTGEYQDDFLALLEHPKEVIHIDDDNKSMVH